MVAAAMATAAIPAGQPGWAAMGLALTIALSPVEIGRAVAQWRALLGRRGRRAGASSHLAWHTNTCTLHLVLVWHEHSVTWQLQDHDMWHGTDDDGRVVAQVAAEWNAETRTWSWAGYYWGDRPPELPVLTIGRDPTLVGSGWATPHEAMRAVETRHAAAHGGGAA